jgi:hypothetical protein
MKRITISIEVADEHHDRVAEMLESCAKRIRYNYPNTGSVRWLDDIVGRPKVVAMRSEQISLQDGNPLVLTSH